MAGEMGIMVKVVIMETGGETGTQSNKLPTNRAGK